MEEKKTDQKPFKKTRRKDEKISPEIAKRAAQASIENAQKLMRVAELSANEGIYGVAVSLLIIALEEIGKALTLELMTDLYHYQKQGELPRADTRVEHSFTSPIFEEHWLKKFLLFSMIPPLSIMQKAGKHHLQLPKEVKEKILASINQFDPARAAKNNAEGQKLPNQVEVHSGKSIQEIMNQSFSNLYATSKEYELLRLKGLYVDIVNGKIRKPADMTAEQFSGLSKYAKESMPVAKNTIEQGYPMAVLDLMSALLLKRIREAKVTTVRIEAKDADS